MVDDGAGAYLAVYHVFDGGSHNDIFLASSTDLLTWTRELLLYTDGDMEYQPIATHGGTTSWSNVVASIVQSPTEPGRFVLFVSLFLQDGYLYGEPGQAIWYRHLP